MEILSELIIILSVAAVVLYISTKLNLPSVVGLLIAGVLVGPYGIELISTPEEVDTLAEIGILLLLFSIGIEFSLGKLIEVRKYVMVGGAFQVGLSMLLFFGGAYLLGVDMNQAIFMGMLLAMSSTAIVLQLFQDKGWMSTIFGKSSVSILIFQDIIIIPMMLFAPYLAASESADSASWQKVVLGILLIVVVVIAARKLVPPLLRSIVHSRNQELFLISIIVICFATAFITQQLGLKLALGAFLAGLVISESEYSFEALKNIMPFKKVFTAIFFISVGMLLNLSFIIENVLLIAGLTLGVMMIKLIIVVGINFYLKTGFRNALVSGIALCQVGEFAFILSKVGLDTLIIDDFTYQIFLSISILSMIVSAILISRAPKLAEQMMQLPIWRQWFIRHMDKQCLPNDCLLSNHTVIIGYGPGGKRISDFLLSKNEQLAVIERNERNMPGEIDPKMQFIIGNAMDNQVLKRAAIESAKRVIITVPEAAVAEDLTIKIRQANHNTNIVVRTKYAGEIEQLQKLGADRVIPEELSVAEMIMASFG